ncbi:MAG TPA: MYG1 family protein [bacterium]|nr:MYG1 family protein [bacterium]
MRIATHDGRFHADELLAIAIMGDIFPNEKIEVERCSRKNVSADADYRIDVGGKFDPATNNFDHHIKGWSEKRENGIPYASAGLVWKYFGPTKYRQEVVDKVDERFVQIVDARDNGLSNNDSFYELLFNFNPNWDEDETEVDKNFCEALQIVKTVFNKLLRAVIAEVEASDLIKESLERSDGQKYIVLEKSNLPWIDPVVEFNHKLSEDDKKDFVIYPSISGGWRVIGIPIEKGSFTVRKKLPQSWGGLKGEEFQRESGIPDAIFCHHDRYMAGAEIYESVVKMTTLVE